MSRSIRFAAALAAITLAACTDAPVAPAPSAPVADPALARIKFPATVLVSARTVTTSGTPVAMTVKFTSGTTNPTVVETYDNSELDLDPRFSYVQVRILKSTVYQAQATKGDVLLYKKDSPKILIVSGEKVDFGNLVLKYNPFIEIQNTDFVTGTATAGGKYQFTGFMTLSDNDPFNDYEPLPGRIRAVLQGIGTYQVCELAAPGGYAMLSPACFDVQTGDWGTTTVVKLKRRMLF